MKKLFVTSLCLCITSVVYAQPEVRVNITSFEEGGSWEYVGGNISESVIAEQPLEDGVNAPDGTHALSVTYDNFLGGPWTWAQLDFADGPYDLSGLTELHMWVHFSEASAGEKTIQLFLSDADAGIDYNIGTQTVENFGEWTEVIWQINPLISPEITNITHFGGFIEPGVDDAFGTVYLDNIFALRPEGMSELQGYTIYSFEEADENRNNQPEGLFRPEDNADGVDPYVGSGDIAASDGDNYAVITLTSGWIINIKTLNGEADALNTFDAFDRWEEVEYIAFDVYSGATGETASWLQLGIALQSGWENQEDNTSWDLYDLQDISGFTDDWGTIIFDVDMNPHATAFSEDIGQEGFPGWSWYLISIITNNDPAIEGEEIFLDNVRVFAPADETDVTGWNLY